MMNVRLNRFDPFAEHGFCRTDHTFRCQIAIDIDGVSAPEQRIDDFSGCRVLLPQYVINVQPAADIAALMLSVSSFSDDVFKQELALDERLDAIIDRADKRLIQTKAMKQMLSQTGAGRVDAQPKAIVARSTSGERNN